MFRLQKLNNRTSKQGDRVDFRFSNFQVLQVPKGWDRLFLSVTTVETGKLLAKLGKALVKNGSCQWMETVSESLSIPENDPSKEPKESLIKLVVSTGLGRYGVLGEVTINMSQYTSSRVSTAVSQPLKKCSYGTVLQVKIQCLSPRSKVRNEESESLNSEAKDQKEENNDMPSSSNNSRDSTVEPGTRDLATTGPRLLKLESKVVSRSATDQCGSFESLEGEIKKGDLLSSKDDLESEEYNSRGKRVDGSYEDSPVPDNHLFHDNSSSIHSSLNSRSHLREDLQNETSVARSSTSIISTSRNLLEVAEDTIEELRAEAKMWERNARKLAIDLDVSRKEFSDQSKKQSALGVQLSAAYSENDGLKREIDKLKLELRESKTKQGAKEDSSIQSKSLLHIQKILENEIKYQQSLNADLGEQMKQSQESNIQLVSVLQELEETIEQQRAEIENLSSLKLDYTDLENKIARNSEEKSNLLLQLKRLQESEKTFQADIQLLEKAMKDKTDELENTRRSQSQSLFHVEKDYKSQISRKDKDITRLEENLSRHVDNENNDLLRETESLREKVQELEKDCAELTDENLELLVKLKESNKTDIRKCSSFGSISSEHAADCPSDDSEASDPKSQISNLDEELEQKTNEDARNDGFGSSEQFPGILKQLEVALRILMKPWYGISSNANATSKIFFHELMNAIKEKATAERVCSFLHELNTLLELRITECEDILQGHEIDIQEKSSLLVNAERRMEESILEVEKHEKLKANALKDCAELIKELDQKALQVDLIEGDLQSKELENKFLIQRKTELETEITELHQEKSNLEHNIELVLQERNATSECIENLQNDVAILRNCIDSHASANTILERKSEELEREKEELGNNLLASQEENLLLQECIFDLEAEIRNLKEENGFFKQETDSFKSAVTSLQDEIRKLKCEMDREILDMKQKSEDMNKQWLEAQKECEDLKVDNQTLQASSASSKQEIIKLQNSNIKLNKDNQELNQSISEMVTQLTKSRKCLADLTKKIEMSEDHLDSVLKDFTIRENSLKSEVDALFQEIRNHKEKFTLGESLNHEFLETIFTFENFKIEVEHLNRQISDAKDDKERISSEAANEISRLHAEKSEMEFRLQEAQSDAEVMKNTLDAIRLESESKFKGLTGQLSTSQKSHEMVLADRESILKLLENYKINEEKLMTGINDLELKLTMSDYERQQLTKEMSMLKVQLQNKSSLQDKISILKNQLQECLTEKGKLEQSLQMATRHYEEMKTENVVLSENISTFQVALSECEEIKRQKLALEEKLLRMESELTTKENPHAQISSLKNDLAEIRRANIQFQLKIYTLEEEKNECFEKAQKLKEELELMGEINEIREEGAKDGDFTDGSPIAVGMDHATKLQLLESESAEALNANSNNRVQNDRVISTRQSSSRVSSKKSALDGAVTRKMYDRTKSSLEIELRDLRERYLQMSLKYAEVEAQREDLVMKLRVASSGKRWFS